MDHEGPGDLLARLVAAAGEDERERGGGTDPQSIAEFTAYDIPFEVEPATGFAVPERERG